MVLSRCMNAWANSVQWIWAFSVAAQTIVFALLVIRKHFQKLQFFTFYIFLNLCQASFLYFLFRASPAALNTQFYYLAWASEAITLVAKVFATLEILRLVLGPYQSIWGLAWRLVLGTSAAMISVVFVMYGGNVQWAILEADRGYYFVQATAIIACLLLFQHYRVPITAVYKTLLAGFCGYACVAILFNTFLKSIFSSGYGHYEAVWQAVTTSAFAIVQVAWAIALRKPLPIEDKMIAKLPPGVYGQISPEINLGLRQLDEQLGKFWKVEVPRP